MEIKKIDSSHYAIRLDAGEEIIESLASFAKREKIPFASLIAIGALKQVELKFFDPEKKEYLTKVFPEDYELLTASGNITTLETGEPFVHLHGVLGDRNYQTLGGHISKAIVAVTIEAFAQRFDTPVSKIKDSAVGIRLWKF